MFFNQKNKEKYSEVSTTQDISPKQENPFLEIIRFALIALIIVVPIRMFIAQPFIVSGASMESTFYNGQYLIVDQLTYLLESPKRGEVVVFRYPKNPSKFFIKRVIGVPGDKVSIQGKVITVTNEEYPDGVVLQESYVKTMSDTNDFYEELGEHEYFVMGDNRDHSSDSRIWGILHEDKIVGRAFLRLFPLNQIGIMPGEYPVETLTE